MAHHMQTVIHAERLTQRNVFHQFQDCGHRFHLTSLWTNACHSLWNMRRDDILHLSEMFVHFGQVLLHNSTSWLARTDISPWRLLT